ncbi:Acyl transferase/acyl hydrolase/lysophospholipase [Penicillium malachiteum]|uniref:Acyl transferase/acyl hydrolase/lysophospholipase n=1 Tax=Penicillium malachiteum TaxID=1324776 RepID=UPI0025469E69|nr:Acyl transferase/acyl hydrolase/lysophospholipase [Penicillium malachiteum]KAJ5735329.1 Acyl transferase/acyl hydrolase/lysophospholipase [Penicillium malachiteum]
MAMEGVRQVAFCDSAHPIRGYRLRHVEITRALTIPDTTEGVEVQLLLKPQSPGSLSPKWREFHISSATVNGDWVEHCHGLVGLDTEEPSDQGPRHRLSSTARINLGTKGGAYFRSIESADMFQASRNMGINHGPLFQKLTSIRAGSKKAMASFLPVDSVATQSPQSSYVVHPITVDSIFQVAYAALSKDAQWETGAAIPKSIKEIYVSDLISRETNHKFQAFVNLEQWGARGFDALHCTGR